MKKFSILRLVYAALCLALCIVLPFVTGQIPQFGQMLSPMHLPALLCGFLCGWQYGATIGFILPFLRSICFGMPPLYPNAVWMAAELLTYGLVIGLLFNKLPKNLFCTYISLITSQVIGRIIWAIAKTILMGATGKAFTYAMFISGGFIDALPGIILQLLLIPTIITILKHTKYKFN